MNRPSQARIVSISFSSGFWFQGNYDMSLERVSGSFNLVLEWLLVSGLYQLP